MTYRDSPRRPARRGYVTQRVRVQGSRARGANTPEKSRQWEKSRSPYHDPFAGHDRDRVLLLATRSPLALADDTRFEFEVNANLPENWRDVFLPLLKNLVRYAVTRKSLAKSILTIAAARENKVRWFCHTFSRGNTPTSSGSRTVFIRVVCNVALG